MRRAGPAYVERQSLEIDAKIHVAHVASGGRHDARGCEIQDREDARVEASARRLRRRFAGDGEHGDVDGEGFRERRERVDVRDTNGGSRPRTDPGRIEVEDGDHGEAAGAESRIVRQRRTETARSHDRDTPGTVEAQDRLEIAQQARGLVSDASDAELAEGREVFADLRGA